MVHVLRALPASDVRALVAVVLRQPARKQAALAPVWGRLAYTSALGRPLGPERDRPAIFLEAQPIGLTWRRAPASTRPDDADELDRLRADGHRITRERKGWRIESTPDAIRATQPYRTLLHEIGHHVDRVAHRAASTESDDAAIDRRFLARPARERAAAHRYASEQAARLRETGKLPFEPIREPELCDGIDPAWFVA